MSAFWQGWASGMVGMILGQILAFFVRGWISAKKDEAAFLESLREPKEEKL